MRVLPASTVGQADPVVEVQVLVHQRIAQVAVDQGDPGARHRESEGQVGGSGGLALVRQAARDQDGPQTPLDFEVLQVGAQ